MYFPEKVKNLIYVLNCIIFEFQLVTLGVKSHKVEIMQKKDISLVTNSSYFAHTTPLLFNPLFNLQDGIHGD